MSGRRPLAATVALTALALLAFAANSLLCRAALVQSSIDPATFTALRLASGAAALAAWVLLRGRGGLGDGDWPSALALFAYAIAFSWAYLSLGAGTGALVLFAAVQGTMLFAGWQAGERLRGVGWFGLALALTGLVVLLAPGASAPQPLPALAMAGAGMAWGVYSLRVRRSGDPVAATAGNFLRSMPLALVALAIAIMAGAAPASPGDWEARGVGLAVASGMLASGLGYVIWYAVLPSLQRLTAATLQLAVPVIAALAGAAWLAEMPDWRLGLASVLVLVGLGLVIRRRQAPG